MTRKIIIIFMAGLLLSPCVFGMQKVKIQNLSACLKIDESNEVSAMTEEESLMGFLSRPVTVMTRNVYVGTDVDMIMTATHPEEVPVLVTQAFGMLLATDFHERVQSLANEIQLFRPHLIGLQEISTIRIQTPGDCFIGNPVQAEDILYDYLEILMEALRDKGLLYEVAGKVQNADVEMPMIDSMEPLQFSDVRLTDFDVILARSDVKISNVIAQNYMASLVIDTLGIVIPRGYVAVDAVVKGKKYRFVNTHLEPVTVPELLPLQMAQAQELMGVLQAETLPVILVGDFNSDAIDGPTYQLTTSSGYTDVWLNNLFRYNPNGLTYGHDLDLMNDDVNFSRRIDFIFVKTPANVSDFGTVFGVVVGDEQYNRTQSGLWPSDHGGVVARLRFSRR